MSQKPKFNSIQQTVYDETVPESLRITNYGKTAGGAKVPILVDVNGVMQSNGQDVLNLSASLSTISPKFAVINIATAGDNGIVSATVSKKTIVLDYVLVVGANGDGLTWKNDLGGTAISGQMRFAANGGVSTGYSPVGHFQSASGGTLTLNSSLGSQVSGHLVYVVV